MRSTGTADRLVSVLTIVFALSVAGVDVRSEEAPRDFIIPRHSPWRYFADIPKPPDDWTAVGFQDAHWQTGEAGFGYGDDDDRTVLHEMRGRFTSVYIRRAFDVADPQQLPEVYLHVDYDDGFIAYLNGTQVAASHTIRKGGSVDAENHEAGTIESFRIRNAASLLRQGRNVLAIEGHNVDLNSSDFSLDPSLSARPLGSLLVRADFLADLDEFERRLLDQSSYLTLRDFDFVKAIEEVRRSITNDTDLTKFITMLQKVLMQLGDCHASVNGKVHHEIFGFLPFRPADTDQGLAALRLNSDEPIEAACPYIDVLDGIALRQWLDIAMQRVPHGSPQLRRRRAIEKLEQFDLFREELRVPRQQAMTITLRSADARNRVQKKLRLTKQGFSVASLPLQKTRLLDGNIGYLRIPEMESRIAESLAEKVREFRDTAGLIIDVRDNGGGSYDILHALYPLFRPVEAGPYVTNIAAYRLSTQFDADHLAHRPTYRATWSGWNALERTAIRNAAAKFQPEWVPPPGKFSEWHYMLLNCSYGDGKTEQQKNADFFYKKPVVVLSNAGSFSATDGFLSAFADLPQVTIVGEPSAGGSGSARRFTLKRTQVQVRLSSMASFRPNGKLFDGNGVEVDVYVRPVLKDFTDGVDSVLARGVQVIVDQQ